MDDALGHLCPTSKLPIGDCECKRCVRAAFDLYYAKREAEREAAGIVSPEQLGRQRARAEIANASSQPRR